MRGLDRRAAGMLVILLCAGCASGGRLPPPQPAAAPPEPVAARVAPPAPESEPAGIELGDFEPEPPPEPLAGVELGDFEVEPPRLAELPAIEPEPIPEIPAEQPLTARQELLLGGPCVEPRPAGEPALDAARRRLFQTVCGAALWFDGLFGERRDIGAARRSYGRVELSFTDSAYWGFKPRTRFHVKVRFPNIDERIDAFIGRDDEEDFVRDRNEGFSLRTQFHELEEEDDWVAGLGYGIPGRYHSRTDFRIGAKGGREPEVFVQGRLRRNIFIGERSLWHVRPTVFWTNRKKAGTTFAIDYDHVLSTRHLFRWANVASYTEETEGLDWRVATILYHNLVTKGRAIAWEAFVRGETDAEVPLREFGGRAILRRPLKNREWLFGELYLGYTWPREEIEEDREGSYSVGFGLELLFGREPRR